MDKTAASMLFKDIPIGGLFHDGIGKGIGIDSDETHVTIYEKVNKSNGDIVKADWSPRHLGVTHRFSPFQRVWIIEKLPDYDTRQGLKAKEAGMDRFEKIARNIEADLTLSDKDKAVIDAFTDGKEADSKKLSTDGKTLDGNWMGGKEIAIRDSEGVITPGEGRPHVKSDEIVLRALKKMTPSRYYKGSDKWWDLDKVRDIAQIARMDIVRTLQDIESLTKLTKGFDKLYAHAKVVMKEVQDNLVDIQALEKQAQMAIAEESTRMREEKVANYQSGGTPLKFTIGLAPLGRDMQNHNDHIQRSHKQVMADLDAIDLTDYHNVHNNLLGLNILKVSLGNAIEEMQRYYESVGRMSETVKRMADEKGNRVFF